MDKRQPRSLFLALAILWLPMMIWPPPVNSAGIVGDGNPKSCTEAALAAALSIGGKITFNCGATAHTIPITSQKTIGLNTSIDGQHLITLSGRNLIRLFSVTSGVTLSLQQLTLANGNATLGGAIYNAGNVVITDSALINNQASGGSGGSIYNDGKLTITNSRLSNNVAQDGLGGAIYNAGELTLQNSILSDNYGELAGGGILNSGTAFITQDTLINNSSNYGGGLENRGTVMIENSNITSNTTTYGMGGGVHNTGQLTVIQSTFAGNSSATWQYGGGLANQGNAKVANSLILNNTAPDGLGAGIYNNGQMTLVADTLASNQTGSGWGGGIYSAMAGTLEITNTTFSGNSGGHDGGGLYVIGSAMILNSTFYNNLPNSIVTIGSANISIRNSIVAGSPITNCKGTITSLGNNLEDHDTCGLVMPGDIHDADPGLAPLAYNGGPTPTHALNPGSPAINGGANDACPVDDQRGARRPVFGICDIGAYEYGFSTSLPLVTK